MNFLFIAKVSLFNLVRKRLASGAPRLRAYLGKIQTESHRVHQTPGMNIDDESLMEKREMAHYRMNHLSRLVDPTMFERILRGKRTSFWLSEYLFQTIKKLEDKIDEKKALIRELDRLEDKERMTSNVYHG